MTTINIKKLSQTPIQKLSFTLVIFLHFYYNIKTVTFMVFDIPIPNFINSTIDIYDFPEKIMGNGINEKMFVFS